MRGSFVGVLGILSLSLVALPACSSDSGGDGAGDDGAGGSLGPGSRPPATDTGTNNGTPTGATASLDCGGHGCGVKQIALGVIAACVLLEDTTVACYGGGIVGTLGRGAERPEVDPVPKRVPNLKNVAKVYGGGYSMCALLDDGTVTCWGPDQSANPYGARPGDRFVVDGLPDVVDLAVATSHTCALTSGGDVYCFGSNYFGELGDGSIDNSRKPVKAKVSGVTAIATGGELSCAIARGGAVSCWGLNDQGQLGRGDADKLIHPDPSVVPGLGGPARRIAASSVTGAVCAALEGGATKCWGEKIAGAPPPGATEISVGWSHACRRDDAGAIACWGASNKGQLGAGNTLRGATSIVTGGHSSCAVLEEGKFACWGDDSRGQLGGGRAGATRPVPAVQHF